MPEKMKPCGLGDDVMQYDFTVVGTAATVSVLKVDEMPEQGKSTAVLNSNVGDWQNGGMGFNICAGLARLGARVYPVLTYVDTRQKEFLHEFTSAFGMPQDGIQDPPADSSGTTLMIQDRKKNHMTLVTDYVRRLPESTYFAPQKMEEHFFSNSRMAIYTVPMAVNARPALEAIQKNNIPLCLSMRRDEIAFPVELVREAVLEAEIIFANKEEADYICNIFGLADVKKLLGLGKLKHFVQTLGREGSRVYSFGNNEAAEIQVPALLQTGKEAETIGAGDGYVSGFMYGYINGMDIKTCAAWGSTVSSFVIEKEGSVTNLPTRHQMTERYLAEYSREDV